MVPGAGIEPARRFGAADFKSAVSTCFTTRAYIDIHFGGRTRNRTEIH